MTRHGAHDCHAAAVVAIAVAAYSVGLATVDRGLLFAAAAIACASAWQSSKGQPAMSGAAVAALGAQAIVMLTHCADSRATAATAMAAAWTLGMAVAVGVHDLARRVPALAGDIGAAGAASAVVMAVLAGGEANFGAPSLLALAMGGALVGANPLVRAYTGFARPLHLPQGRHQTLASSCVWWVAVAVLAAAVIRAALRCWGGP